MVYEEAGWPGALDKERLREGARELEQALWDAWDGAEGAEEECRQAVYCLVHHFNQAADRETNASIFSLQNGNGRISTS
jgi:hypothetical protein